MTTNQMTAKQFASRIINHMGRERAKRLNGIDLIERLSGISRDCERLCRSDIYEDLALPFEYNPVSYGLWWVVSSGRVNGTTVLALRDMTVRQLCELVHTLLVECGSTTENYARFLMERYTRAA